RAGFLLRTRSGSRTMRRRGATRSWKSVRRDSVFCPVEGAEHQSPLMLGALDHASAATCNRRRYRLDRASRSITSRGGAQQGTSHGSTAAGGGETDRGFTASGNQGGSE